MINNEEIVEDIDPVDVMLEQAAKEQADYDEDREDSEEDD